MLAPEYALACGRTEDRAVAPFRISMGGYEAILLELSPDERARRANQALRAYMLRLRKRVKNVRNR